MKAMRIKMIYRGDGCGIIPAGKVFWWSVGAPIRSWNCGGNLERARYVRGWPYMDHEGYERFAEGSWRDLVAAFKATADNYGMDCTIS